MNTPQSIRCIATLLFAALLMGCGESPDIDQAVDNIYEGKGLTIAETRDFVYIERPLQALGDQEQREAYQYAVDTLTLSLEESSFSDIPGAGGLLDRMWAINMSDTIEGLERDLIGYEMLLEERLDARAPKTNYIPSGLIAFAGMPISASAAVGVSGAITAMAIIKPYKITRINKHTGEVDDEWFRFTWDASDAAFIKAGVGIGAGGGVGLHGGLGVIYGDLETPESFRGQSAMLSMVPFAGGVGPVFKAGLRWDSAIEDSEPDNMFFMLGVEAGATAKAFETHVQVGNVTGLWKWVAAALGFDTLEQSGQLDPQAIE